MNQPYCLDANVLIQAWQKYYSPKIFPGYWTFLSHLGSENRVFLSKSVFDEITRTEDDLLEWLKQSQIPVRQVSEAVTRCLNEIFSANPLHKYLVDNTRQRSLADPWIIAHAMNEKACVVTKEEKVLTTNTTRIKIPNVCDNMGIRWVNDFQFIEELNVQFSISSK